MVRHHSKRFQLLLNRFCIKYGQMLTYNFSVSLTWHLTLPNTSPNIKDNWRHRNVPCLALTGELTCNVLSRGFVSWRLLFIHGPWLFFDNSEHSLNSVVCGLSADMQVQKRLYFPGEGLSCARPECS